MTRSGRGLVVDVGQFEGAAGEDQQPVDVEYLLGE
jgi:hypothetical protein